MELKKNMAEPSTSNLSVVSLKVHKQDSGKEYPWDKVYFFKESDYPTVKRAFPYALVFKVDGGMMDLLRNVSLNKLLIRTKGRREYVSKIRETPPDACGAHVPKDLGAVASDAIEVAVAARALGVDFSGPSSMVEDLCRTLTGWWHASEEERGAIERSSSWYQLIPILPRYARKASTKHNARLGVGASHSSSPALKPSYIVNKRWVHRKEKDTYRRKRWNASHKEPVLGSTKVKTVPDDAFLLVEGGVELDPPCAACGNLLNHVQGDCELGGASCYRGMNFGDKSYFKRGLIIKEMLKDMPLIEAYKIYLSESGWEESSSEESNLTENS